MTAIDLDTLRRDVRALDYVRGTPAEDEMWREDDADFRATLVIEGMALSREDDALFDLLRDERVPLPSPQRSSFVCWTIPTRTRR